MRKQKFYTDKQGRCRPITPRRPHVGTLQTGVAHLSVPKRMAKPYVVDNVVNSLTEKEKHVLVHLWGLTNFDTLSDNTKLDSYKLRGVISSLKKKGLVDVDRKRMVTEIYYGGRTKIGKVTKISPTSRGNDIILAIRENR